MIHRPRLSPENYLLSKPNTISGRMQRIALQYLRQKEHKGEIPTSIRFLFYELEQRGHISKEKEQGKTADYQNLVFAVTHLRSIGAILWEWLTDESRRVNRWNCAASVMDAVIDYAEYARIDPWLSADQQPIIISEAKTVGGVLSRTIGYDYLAPIATVSGPCRGFLETDVRDLFLAKQSPLVLYLGDGDDAGDDIETSTRRILSNATAIEFDEVNWQRLMITDAQMADLRARGVEPIEKRDNRYLDGNPHQAYECEALGQGEIQDIVRARLDELLPEPLDDIRKREDEQRVRCSSFCAG
jgi:hypothetical protein